MRSPQDLAKEIEALRARVEAIMAVAKEEDRELLADEIEEIDSIVGTDSKPGKIAELVEAKQRAEKIKAHVIAKGKEVIAEEEAASKPAIKIPARARAAGRLQAFKKEEDAYASGQWIMANLFGSRKAKNWCREHGIRATMTTTENVAGGFLVPDALESTIIELREQYGVARRECQQVTMGDAKMIVPRLDGEATAYYVGEGATITPSDLVVNTIQLDAKKLAAVVAVSSELNEDSVISIGEMVARSVAQSFAIKEDEALFLGNGTSTFGGINGLANALGAGTLVTASGLTTFSALTIGNFESVVGARKLFGTQAPKWYISQAGWAASMQRLANVSGGATSTEIQNGVMRSFLGYEVVVSQVLTSALTGTSAARACYFGNLAQGVMFGSRRGITLAVDNSLGFLTDTINIRATERFDIVVHDRGTAAASGGIIGLVFG
jgi:HK97 family phage major capsid protein